MASNNLRASVVNSALWAAYADALGFMTELGDADAVEWRTGQRKVTGLTTWRRRVGGRFGVIIEFPAGVYSDDTQLRLATCRALRSDGGFDVEAFAKVELPVWLSYALGAGRGTKAAATNLLRRDVNWFSNFFDQKGSNYLNAGGNGAAMRIQPHVWVELGSRNETRALINVFKNSITTHGHARGIYGALFHAKALWHSFSEQSVPDPVRLRELAFELRHITSLVEKDPNLSTFWLPAWQKKQGYTLEEAAEKTISEIVEMLDAVQPLIDEEKFSKASVYQGLLDKIGAFDPSSRGSGTVTAVAASAVAWLYSDSNISDCINLVANALGSDTDSIATMAGSLMGALPKSGSPEKVLDSKYIGAESDRLAIGAEGTLKSNFSYPDVGAWKPPKAQADVLVRCNNHLLVAGLGNARSLREPVFDNTRNNYAWQWVKLSFGQTILVKRREELRSLDRVDESHLGEGYSSARSLNQTGDNLVQPIQEEFFRRSTILGERQTNPSVQPNDEYLAHASELSLDALSALAIREKFSPELIGKHILQLSEGDGGIEKAIAYAAIIAKAVKARRRK